ncbi:glycosyltransferase family 2 protein [Flavobacterium sp.]
MSHILVSIIIPTYNREHLIGNTLLSLLNQTYKNWECIIVDDGSTDATEKTIETFIEKDYRFNFYKREKLPKGASHCRNIGLSKSKGNFVIFLDSDDQLLDFCLEQRIRYSTEFPENDFYVFPMLVEKEQNTLVQKIIPYRENYLNDFLNYKIFWGIMCTFWKRDFLIDLEGFNINYQRLNDPEIHIRALLLSTNYKVFNSSTPDSKYVMAEAKDYPLFAKKYLDTLTYFIPDIISLLVKFNKIQTKHYLRSYLIVWLKHFLKFATISDTKSVLKLFLINRVITQNELYLLKLYLILNSHNNKVSNKFKDLIIKKISPNAS